MSQNLNLQMKKKLNTFHHTIVTICVATHSLLHMLHTTCDLLHALQYFRTTHLSPRFPLHTAYRQLYSKNYILPNTHCNQILHSTNYKLQLKLHTNNILQTTPFTLHTSFQARFTSHSHFLLHASFHALFDSHTSHNILYTIYFTLHTLHYILHTTSL